MHISNQELKRKNLRLALCLFGIVVAIFAWALYKMMRAAHG